MPTEAQTVELIGFDAHGFVTGRAYWSMAALGHWRCRSWEECATVEDEQAAQAWLLDRGAVNVQTCDGVKES